MKIILYQPQIPQNTGNIARTCSVTGSELILVRPLGFSTQNRWLKRAGLDYWEGVKIEEIDDLSLYLEKSSAPFFFFSSKAKQIYTKGSYQPNAILIFGSETSGLPFLFWEKYPERFYTIPMVPNSRCLNLASSAAVVLYEALRQTQFCFEENKESTKERAILINAEEANGI